MAFTFECTGKHKTIHKLVEAISKVVTPGHVTIVDGGSYTMPLSKPIIVKNVDTTKPGLFYFPE